MYEEGAVLLSFHDKVPDLIICNLREPYGHKLIIHGPESDAQCRRDNDIRAPCDELRVKVTEVVFEAGLHDRLKGLLCKNQCVLIITVQLHLIDLLHFVQSLQLVGRVH